RPSAALCRLGCPSPVPSPSLPFLFSLPRPPPRSPLFPYTTLFRSEPCRIETAEPDPATSSGLGPEAHARALRYRALERARHREGARAILLAHTRDDQAETVLLALARGSGTRSLGAMAPVRNELWRPLLTISGCQTPPTAPTARGAEPTADRCRVPRYGTRCCRPSNEHWARVSPTHWHAARRWPGRTRSCWRNWPQIWPTG